MDAVGLLVMRAKHFMWTVEVDEALGGGRL